MQPITRKNRFFSVRFFLILLSILATSAVLSKGSVHAAGPSAHHNMLLNKTANRYNALLNVTANQGDVTDAPGLPPALCASYTQNPYANPAPNVDMITGDTIVKTGTQTGCKAAQNETTIAVNPSNPLNIVAGANDYRVFNARENRNDGSGYAYTSKDGGKTWANIQLPHLTYQTGATGALSDIDSAGDPAISFGPDNTVYYANLVFSRLNSASGTVVSISHDGGLTWGEPSIVHLDGVDASGNPLPTGIFNDKEWVAVDPHNSQIAYVTWTTFLPDNTSPIVVSATHDGGKTWSTPNQVTPAFVAGGITPYDQGSIPVVNREGTLFISYEGAVCQDLTCSGATDHDEAIVAKSTDGGKTFTSAQVDRDYDFPVNPSTGRSGLTGENFRVNSFPQFTIDRYTNRLYITWADDRNGLYDPATGNSIKTNGDVLLASSLGGGKWNNEITLGTSADEVFPAVAALNGHAMVSYYTRAYDPTGINLDYAYQAVVTRGNYRLLALPVTRITTQSENPQIQFVAADLLNPNNSIQGVFIGDYTAVAVGTDGVYHPCWTDFRGNPGVNLPNQDAYTQAVHDVG